MWGYYWGLSERQIDLLLVDQALVVYKHNKTKGKKGKNGTREMATPSSLKIAEAEAKWNAKYRDRKVGEKIKLDFQGYKSNIGNPEP